MENNQSSRSKGGIHESLRGKNFNAVCSECGSECNIPFEPKEGRPVKCNDCFRKVRRPYGKFNRRKDFDVVCGECGKKTTVPFEPTQGKPVLCRDCFRK